MKDRQFFFWQFFIIAIAVWTFQITFPSDQTASRNWSGYAGIRDTVQNMALEFVHFNVVDDSTPILGANSNWLNHENLSAYQVQGFKLNGHGCRRYSESFCKGGKAFC